MYKLLDDNGQTIINLPIRFMAEHIRGSDYPPYYGVRGIYKDVIRRSPRVKTVSVEYFEYLWRNRN